jgi:hypothetical protein
MTYKIYCVEGPDETSLFDDPEKPYNEDDIDETDDITQKINITDDELDNDIDDDEDTADDEEV